MVGGWGQRHPSLFLIFGKLLTLQSPLLSQWRSQTILWGGAFHKYAELSNLISRGRVLNIGVAYNELNMHILHKS